MAALGEVTGILATLWPPNGAEEWDVVGLVSGRPRAEIRTILLAVDAVRDTVEEAATVGADLLLTHHPLLLRPVTSIAEDQYKGALLGILVRADCALYSAHTNADVTIDGTSATLARALDLRNVAPIVAAADGTTGLGRVGELSQSTLLGDLARRIALLLPATAGGVRVSGDYNQSVRRVALCAGAGDSLLAHPAVTGADVYITADLRHHPAQEARQAAQLSGGAALIDVSHWASEWLWLDSAATALRAALPGIDIRVSEIRTDPWDFMVVQ